MLSVSPLDMRDMRANPGGDLMTGYPCLNPVHAICRYPYAVQRIGPKSKAGIQQETIILALRDHEDIVRFIEVNPVTAQLVELLESGKFTGTAALAKIAAELQHTNPEAVIQGGIVILDQLRAAQVILGTEIDKEI